ncbi:hypothetical protein CY35_02G164700 [Sphagnum magellanicum]|nr:hypothetical protein CY35_02G164700 [Sphagnum magellanicum]
MMMRIITEQRASHATRGGGGAGGATMTITVPIMFNMTMLTMIMMSMFSIRGASATGANGTNYKVGALFIFGDSTVDCGNNNYLLTIARANFPPFGMDFDTHLPTGRFCNGRLTEDFICEKLGLPLIPAYLSPESANYLTGANFASAGAGVLNDTGNDLGEHIALQQQIQMFMERRAVLEQTMGVEAAHDLIANSVMYISIGGNEYIHNYITNGSESSLSPEAFTDLVLASLSDRITELYNGGARKMTIASLGPMGCAPFALHRYNSTDSQCIEFLNDLVKDFNTALHINIVRLNEIFPDATILYMNIYDIVYNLTQNPQAYGFQVADTACCGVGTYRGAFPCMNTTMMCDTPETYVWWDLYHPSHLANRVIADSVWNTPDDSPDFSLKSFHTLANL